MNFSIAGTAFVGISPFGGSEPEDNYYKGRIVKVESTKKTDSAQLTVQFEGATFEKFTFINFPDMNLLANGTDDEKKRQRGRIAAIRSLLASLGYTDAQIEGGVITAEWFLYETTKRVLHFGWCAGEKGVQGSYGDFVEWVTPAVFAAKVSLNEKPSRAGLSRGVAPADTTPHNVAAAFTPPPGPPVVGGPPAAPGFSAPPTFAAPPGFAAPPTFSAPPAAVPVAPAGPPPMA